LSCSRCDDVREVVAVLADRLEAFQQRLGNEQRRARLSRSWYS
jgi:hypothetical protein